MKKSLLKTPSLWLLIPLVGFPQIGETIYTPCLPDMAEAFSTSAQAVNLTLSLYFVGFALGVLSFGTLCDSMGRRPAMLIGLSIYVIGSFFCIASPNISLLLASRFLQGFGASVGSVVVQTMMRDLFSGARRSQVFSIVTAALALSPAIGPLIGGFVDEMAGFKANFAVLFFMGLILLVASIFFLSETQKRDVSVASKERMLSLFQRMLQDSFIWKTVLIVAGCNGIVFSFYGEAPYIFQKILGYTPSEYGRMGMFIALASIVGAFLSHKLGPKLGSENLVKLGALFSLFGSIFFLSLAHFGFVSAANNNLGAVCIIVPMAFIFIGFGLMIPNTLSVALKSYSESLGIAGAFLGLMYYFFIAIFTEGMGFLHDGTVMAMPLYFVILSLLMVLLSFSKRSNNLIR